MTNVAVKRCFMGAMTGQRHGSGQRELVAGGFYRRPLGWIRSQSTWIQCRADGLLLSDPLAAATRSTVILTAVVTLSVGVDFCTGIRRVYRRRRIDRLRGHPCAAPAPLTRRQRRTAVVFFIITTTTTTIL